MINKKSIYEREKLYKEVWNAPITKVAESYGVSDVAIHKACKSLNVPTPPRGYWAKLQTGKEVTNIPPLPSKDNYSKKAQQLRLEKYKDTLAFLSLEEHKRLFDIASTISIDFHAPLCVELIRYQHFIDKWNNTHESMEGKTDKLSKYKYYICNHGEKLPVLAGVLSKEGLERTYKILNCLIAAIKELGYTVNEDMSFTIRNEKVSYDIYERQTSHKHFITAEEQKLLQKYEDKKTHKLGKTRPFIPAHEYRFNGELVFNTLEHYYLRDSEKFESTLEDYLPDILIQLVQQSETVRIERIQKEEEERKREEAHIQAELRHKHYINEIEKLRDLFLEMEDFDRATRIRNYIKEVEANDTNNEKADWIAWAKDKADWYDPTINKNDSAFGTRVHSEKPVPIKHYGRYVW